MSINDIAKKIKSWVGEREKDIFIGLLVLLSTSLSFGLGRLSKLEEMKTPVTIEQTAGLSAIGTLGLSNQTSNQIPTSNPSQGRQYVASKNSTKYHRVDCPGAKAIKEANKIYFSTPAEAKQAGFTPAGNCPGLD